MVKVGKYSIIVKDNKHEIICKETGQSLGLVYQRARRVKGTHRSPFRDAQGYYSYHIYYILNEDESTEFTTRKEAITEAARRAGLFAEV